jgi:hypothetical protein
MSDFMGILLATKQPQQKWESADRLPIGKKYVLESVA